MINVDNNIKNSDWIKWRTLDLPGVSSLNDIMEVFGIPYEEPDRTDRLADLIVYPWVESLNDHARDEIKKAAKMKKKAQKKADKIMKKEKLVDSSDKESE